MIRYSYPMVCRSVGFKNYVTTDLMNTVVTIIAAQGVD